MPDYKSGQYGNFSFSIGQERINRTYSFHTSSLTDEQLAITIRSVKDGKVSNYLLSAGKETDVELLDVGGQFFVEPSQNGKRHLVMFAGGGGITPIMAMIRTVLHAEPESIVSLIYANSSYDRIIFREELRELEHQFLTRFNLLQVISSPSNLPDHFPVFYQGRLSKLITKKVVKNLMVSNPLPTEFYLCGPHAFMTMIEDSLKTMTIDSNVIRKENFFIPNAAGEFDVSMLPSTEVIVRWNGFDRLVPVSTGVSILDGAMKAGITLPHSCKEGACGSCRAQLISGDIKLRKNHILSEAELGQGQVLLCQGFPASHNVVVQPLGPSSK